MRGEYPSLRTIRNYYEALCDHQGRLQLSSQPGRDELQGKLWQSIAERDEQISDERWLGDLLLNRLRLRAPLLALRRVWARVLSSDRALSSKHTKVRQKE